MDWKHAHQFFKKAATHAGAGLNDIPVWRDGRWYVTFVKMFALPVEQRWTIEPPLLSTPSPTDFQSIRCEVTVGVDSSIMDDERALVLGHEITKALYEQFKQKR